MQRYAVVLMVNMKVMEFSHKDELQDAIRSLRERNKPYRVFKFNEGAGIFAEQEVYEPEL